MIDFSIPKAIPRLPNLHQKEMGYSFPAPLPELYE